MFKYWFILIALALGIGSAKASHSQHTDSDKDIVRGITISTHGGGQDWGQDAIVPTLADIKTIGANWVSIHPYGRIGADGSIKFQEFDPKDPPAQLIRPIQEAHKQGLSICIKPHIAYWRTPFQWRGEIEFDTTDEWLRFWTDYRKWILTLAMACREADAFVVGTELDRTLNHEAEWRTLIAEVRSIMRVPLTYAANWTDYKRVPFWDALDVIGIQAYFPVASKPNSTPKEIQTGWKKLMEELRSYSEKMNRKILFAELGYTLSYMAPVEPWNYHTDGEGARLVQESCWKAALAAIDEEPCVVGALLWKWFPYPRPVGRNFALATPGVMTIIADAWEGKVPKIEISEQMLKAWEDARRKRRRTRPD